MMSVNEDRARPQPSAIRARLLGPLSGRNRNTRERSYGTTLEKLDLGRSSMGLPSYDLRMLDPICRDSRGATTCGFS